MKTLRNLIQCKLVALKVFNIASANTPNMAMKYLSQNFLQVIALICICSIQNTMAQVSSKTIFLQGNFSFKDNNSTVIVHKKPNNDIYDLTRNQAQLNSSLGVGYSLFERLIFGGTFNYNFRKEEFGSTDLLTDRNYHTFTWGPFGRFYIINKKVGLFTEVKYLMGKHSDISGYNAEEIQRGTLSTLSFGIGGNYFVTKKFSIEVLAAYQSEKRVGELKPNMDPYANSRISSSSNALQLNFGISYFIKTP
ncbi:MAG: hypothetical protein R2822_20805 [Spirosomataceae bacterium]